MTARTGIVAALTATFTPRFTDHSRPTTCGCAERGSGFSQAQAVAQAGPGGEAGPVTNFQR
ncbi:hypothetical protein SEA_PHORBESPHLOWER_42 [Gordonia phage PhorbesPhlower]|nr:hypothetical protein SEA_PHORBESPHLOWER_42 [Gordonia phage PhorbesPhlower]